MQMKVKDAAKLIGCSTSQVRVLLRAGKLKGQKWITEIGEYWTVDPVSAREYCDTPQSHGFPRGQKRKAKKDA